MMRLDTITLLLLAPVCLAAKPKDLDVQNFKTSADVCVHLSGEWDVDLPEENKAEIKKNMNESCGQAKELYPVLQKRYPHDRAIKQLLRKYPDLKDYEAWN
ncbi:hypothetical protein LQR30_09550 [Chromobacterium piscinae]|uniref:hypothetical protein n=1 Tax=Chromobacterium piscinae TaxID=686831 RepID=UPI001E54FF73|nr:hypothetical protein [Chromobacterium piscinae]MCD4504350.1 hypothetical protein [Chromobacterium piscinae]